MFSINNETWYIKFVPPYSDYLKRSDGSTTVGVTDDNARMIYIDQTLQGKFLKKVLCHELTHVAMFAYNVDLSLEQEEILADIIATYGEEIIEMTNTLFERLKERDI